MTKDTPNACTYSYFSGLNVTSYDIIWKSLSFTQ